MLELLNLSKRFGKLEAVRDITLSLEQGEIRGLIGPNGSGKTTLFNLISGFIRPTSGKIIWLGENIAGASPHVIARKGIIRTFQLTNVLRELTVLENVIIASHLQTGTGLFRQFLGSKRVLKMEQITKERAMDLLQLMDIEKESNKIAGELPGGTQKILSIANALAGQPRLLMLDEPIAGLNTAEKTVIMEKIKILRDRGITVFVVEHDMKAIMNTCDRITAINFGEKIAEGSPEEVSKDKRTVEAYLGRPDYGFA